jgi:hypothetical protein
MLKLEDYPTETIGDRKYRVITVDTSKQTTYPLSGKAEYEYFKIVGVKKLQFKGSGAMVGEKPLTDANQGFAVQPLALIGFTALTTVYVHIHAPVATVEVES